MFYRTAAQVLEALEKTLKPMCSYFDRIVGMTEKSASVFLKI